MPSTHFVNRVVRAGLVAASCLAAFQSTHAQPSPLDGRLYSEQRLFDLGEAAYKNGDYPYAAMHLHAYMQKNPPSLRKNQALAQQVVDTWYYSARQMEAMAQQAKQLPGCEDKLSRAQGEQQGISSGLQGGRPPSIDWDRIRQEAGYH